jgi:catechol 2,3-dioxygenase-like lactoylglutathione lyase family enzyme
LGAPEFAIRELPSRRLRLSSGQGSLERGPVERPAMRCEQVLDRGARVAGRSPSATCSRVTGSYSSQRSLIAGPSPKSASVSPAMTLVNSRPDVHESRRVDPQMSDVIDHVGIRVSDVDASRRMYAAALAELGFSVLDEGEFEGDTYVLFGRPGSDDFSLHAVGSKPGRERVTTGAHVAFSAPDADAVKRWYDTALRHGGRDNGEPGLRPEYSGQYFAAFVLDPDGNNIEAVFHSPAPAND